MKDVATGWFQSYPSPIHSTQTVMENFLKFLPPKCMPKHVYTDGAAEFKGATKRLDLKADIGTPHHSASKATVERCVQTANELTSVALVQSNLDELW